MSEKRAELEAALAQAQSELFAAAIQSPAQEVAGLVAQIDRYRAAKAAVRKWQGRLDMNAFEEGRMTLSEVMHAEDDRERASPTA
jgi:hypothetical protein